MTLLEVILGIAIVLGMMGSVFAFYSYATDIRRRVIERADEIATTRQAVDRMTVDLRSSLTFPFLSQGMLGQPGQMRFIVADLPGESVWVPPVTGQAPAPREQDLRLVGYQLRIPTDEQGQPLYDEEGKAIVDGLERTVQRLITAPKVEEGETFEQAQQVETALIAPNVKFLNLRYLSAEGAWLTSWDGGDLPVAVEITTGTVPLPDDMEVEDYLATHETRTRAVQLWSRGISMTQITAGRAQRGGSQPDSGAAEGDSTAPTDSSGSGEIPGEFQP